MILNALTWTILKKATNRANRRVGEEWGMLQGILLGTAAALALLHLMPNREGFDWSWVVIPPIVGILVAVAVWLH